MASKHRELVRKRTVCLFVIFALLFLGLAGRLAYVQVLNRGQYQDWAKKIRFRDIAIPASRGAIYDRNGQPLAVSIEASGIYACRKEVRDQSKTAAAVAAVLSEDPADVRSKFEGKSSIIWLARQIDPRMADKISGLAGECPGLGVQRDPKRVYPGRSLASHILGFVSTKNTGNAGLISQGVEGLESALNDDLTGSDGLLRTELDVHRRAIPETRHKVRSPVNGKDVYLTIDLAVQHIAETALARMVEKYHPEKACAIVMDPHTGEIYALANVPDYDPNDARSFSSDSWRNHAVSDLYEPGSTLKAVTVAAALNEGISPHAVVACCTGRERIKGGRLTCSLHHPFLSGHGGVDSYEIIRYSCNIGAAHLGLRLGARKLYRYEKAFGLIDKTRAGLPGEAKNFTMPPEDWCRIRIADVGFGQGIAVTPLQMACAYSVIANGGKYVQPRIVREMRGADGEAISPFKPKTLRRVVSRRVAAELTKMLVGCVDEGTGKTAAIPGRSVAGKTGSAQIAKSKGGFEAGAFVSSFIGFAPANNPRLVIAVVVTRPKGSHWGATVAAPVFKEIGEKALWYLKVPADAPVVPKTNRKQDGDRKGLV